MTGLSRLVVASNRVPSTAAEPAAGGLAVALSTALRDTGGLWFGWSGRTVEGEMGPAHLAEQDGVSYAVVDLSVESLRAYYEGYANQTLWPLFHHRVDLTVFDRSTYERYLDVNRLFAERLVPLLMPDDLVWVHDYHLIPLGEELRRLGCSQRLGFFLHIPFPAPEVLSILFNQRRLVRSLLAYDLIGFQSPDDLRSFRDYVVQELRGGSVLPDGRVSAYGRTVRAAVFPIGIDPERFPELAATRDSRRYGERMQESLRGRALVIGVDRLDYSKGLPEKLSALEMLFERYPEHRRRTVFMQIAALSRSDVPQYREIRHQLDAAVGRINGRFGRFDWVPVHYVNKTYSHSVLAGLYRLARVGVVTPLRDGMNLVAKEYVASQEPSDPGVLVLSRFAGAAHQLDGALIVNPYDAQEVSDAVHRALGMPREERVERWQSMMASVTRDSLAVWRDRFVEALSLDRT